MCYELGQYYAAQERANFIDTALTEIDNGSKYDEVIRSMMVENYKKEAVPHQGAYHMYLNEILFNMSECVEQWAKERAERRIKDYNAILLENIAKKYQESRKHFMEAMGMESDPKSEN